MFFGKTAVVFLIVALSVSLSVGAAGPRYTYIEGGVADVDRELVIFDSGEEWFVHGSWGQQRFHVFAEYAEADFGIAFNPPTGDLSEDQWSIGFGWHGMLGERADLVAEAGLIQADVVSTTVVPGFAPMVLSSDKEGFFVRGGVRWRILPRIELEGSITHVDVDNILVDEVFRLAVIGYLKRIGIGVSFATADERDRTEVFLRFEFR